MSLGTLALWIACFLLTYTFPLLNAGLGAAGSFLLYGVICAAGYLYILRNVPETKGITLEALEEQLAQKADEMGAKSFRIPSVTGPNTLHGTAVIYK